MSLTFKSRHYSYECKASVQERPYTARPSRSQQLSNPKLVPKLTEAAPPELQKKEGVADQQLAKLEAERARKRELERSDDEEETGQPRARGRSASFDSVSTISTRDSRSPRPSGPVRRGGSRSPSPVRQQPRETSYASASDRGSRRSPIPAGRRELASPDSMSGDRTYPARDGPSRQIRRDPSSLSRSPSPEGQRRYRSRSKDWGRPGDAPRERQGQRERGAGPENFPSRRERRERSLSPFSKRQALTRSMNQDR